jgi:D-alanyl-D-alanine carboxypeptidase (penicillin-binding protein 5/6)
LALVLALALGAPARAAEPKVPAAKQALGGPPAPPVPPPVLPRPGLTPFNYAPSDWPVISAEAAVLMDAETGQFLYAYNGHRRMYPASLTKMMTVLLAVERDNPKRQITVGQACLSAGETSLNLTPGEHLTLEQLLYGALLPSANDAAATIAEAVGGSVPSFVALMNDKASRLGLGDTHFCNPHGLPDPDHYSSAWDLAVIAREVMLRPELSRIARTQEMILPWEGKPWPRKVFNRNRLLARWPLCDGVKTGYTHEAGRCLAASASWNGWRLIGVVLKARDSWEDSQTLLQWGAANYRQVPIVAKGGPVKVPVHSGVEKVVTARADEAISGVAPRGQNLTPAFVLEPKQAEAPVQIGSKLGELVVQLPDNVTRRASLTATGSVERTLWAKLNDYRVPAAGRLAILALAAGALAHGAFAKASRKGGSRLPQSERGTDLSGPRHRRRRGRPGVGDEGGPGPQ